MVFRLSAIRSRGSHQPSQRLLSTKKTMVAITRDLPDTFVDALQEYSLTGQSICIHTCRAQHAEYVRVLQQHVDRMITLPALNLFPDSVFVEDTIVAVGSDVVLTNPGHSTRVGEVEHMKDALFQFLKDHVTILDDMRQHKNATCDGGDVLRMGDTMFVGMSKRTNNLGFQVLKSAFPSLNVVQVPPVVQGKIALHLKSATTNLNDTSILVPNGEIGDQVVDALERCLGSKVTAYRLDDMLFCNVVAVQGTVIAQKRISAKSLLVLEQACSEQNLNLVVVDTSELATKDAALTCCSVLLELPN